MANVRHPGSAEAGKGQQGSPSSRLRQISLMMVLESFTMLVLSYPFSCYLLLTSEGNEKANDPDKVALNRLLFSVFFYMLYSNKCINFFIYLASGSRFRQALVNVLRHCGATAGTLAGTIALRVRHGVIKVQGQCQGHCQRQSQGQCEGQGQEVKREGGSGQVAGSQTTLSDLPLET
ncbi:uncharacterized protein LOC112558022 isoform X2 [Pomacea canaliculata]|uniref:uncharacterized protein LOC112558022 isoform X2 n=1 Tax=Pomacea canaliculata TaxID=400727 RepID=UPI000D73C63F|nr:uncharacterized protein LOC112558022 isoform X2 [Pomacea canaliculata]